MFSNLFNNIKQYIRQNLFSILVAIIIGVVCVILAHLNDNIFREHWINRSRRYEYSILAMVGFFYATVSYFLITFFQKRTVTFWLHFVLWTFLFGTIMTAIYPGFPGWDFTNNMGSAYVYRIHSAKLSWHGILYSPLNIVLLAVNPKVATVILAQVLMTSCIISYLAERLYVIAKNIVPILILNLFLLASPAFLSHTLHTYRDVIFGLIHLLLAFLLYEQIIRKDGKVIFSRTFGFVVLSFLLCCTRIDGLVVIPVVLLILLFAHRNYCKIFCRYTIISILFVLPIFFAIFTFVKGWDTSLSKQYAVIPNEGILGFIMGREEFYDRDPQETSEVIGKLYNIHLLKKTSVLWESNLFWGHRPGFNKNFTRQELLDFFRVVKRIYLDNPGLYLGGKTIQFAGASGMVPTRNGIIVSAYWSTKPHHQVFLNMKMLPQVGNQHQSNIAKKVIALWRWTLRCDTSFPSPKFLFYNLLPSLFFMGLAVILWSKCPGTALFSSIILCRFPAIFLTVPAGYFNYHYSICLGGLVVVSLFLAEYLYRKRVLSDEKIVLEPIPKHSAVGLFALLILMCFITTYFYCTNGWCQ